MWDRARERRRAGLRNLIRRALYAALLWLSPQGHAADAQQQQAASDAVAEAKLAKLTIESFPAGATGYLSRYRIDFVLPDPRIAAPLRRAAELLRTHTWHFNDALLSLRGGVGLDLALPDAGNLHLSLFPDDDDPARGKRWRLATPPNSAPGRLWSLGACLDAVRTAHDRGAERLVSDREVVLTPQLILDMDRLAGMPGSAQLMLQRAGWRDKVSNRYSEEQVWQVNVRWRF